MQISPTRQAMDELFSLTYEELRRLAGGMLRHEAAGTSPTTLVNEAWIKLAGSPHVADTSPLHFRRIAGRAMRQVLVDAARRRAAVVHGAGQARIPLEEALDLCPSAISDRDILALDDALQTLKTLSPRQAMLVDARFFGGYSCEECAVLLNISEATVMRDWRTVRAWLAYEVRRGLQTGAKGETMTQEAHGQFA